MILCGSLAGTSFSALPLIEIKKFLHPFELQKNQGDFWGMSSYYTKPYLTNCGKGARIDDNFLRVNV